MGLRRGWVYLRTFTLLFHRARRRSIVSRMVSDEERTLPERERTAARTETRASGSDMVRFGGEVFGWRNRFLNYYSYGGTFLGELFSSL